MEQKGCCRKRHEANEKFRGFVCECKCHTSQNSGEKNFRDSSGEIIFKTRDDFRKFIQETEDRAERRVREKLREKIEGMKIKGLIY